MGEIIESLGWELFIKDNGFDKKLKDYERLAKDFNISMSKLLELEDKIKKTSPSSNTPNLSGLKKDLSDLEKQWDKLSTAERKGAEGQQIINKYRTLKQEAGAYSETLNRTVKTLDKIDDLQKKAASSQNLMTKYVENTNSQFSLQNRLLSNLKTLGTAYVSIFAAERFISNLARVRGEFELQQVALRAIIQDGEAADKIFSQIKGLAIESPFQFKELTSYVKQLAAFSVETDNLYDVTKKLADISAGLGVDMGRIILAYGQVRSASVLRGQELRQFTEAGIPLVDELAKKFSELEGRVVSAGEVFGKISNRMVSFQMVDEILTELTSEGGKFFDQQRLQAETLAGSISNLQDKYEIMLNDIGKANDGILKGGVNALAGLMEHWEALSTVIMSVVIALGTYNATIAISNALSNKLAVDTAFLAKTQKSLIAAQTALALSSEGLNATKVKLLRQVINAVTVNGQYSKAAAKAALSNNIFTKSFRALGKVLSKNIFATMLAGFAALAYAAYNVHKNYIDQLSSSEEAAKRVETRIEGLNKAHEKERSEYKTLNDTIKTQIILLKNRNGSYNELKQIYPDIFNNYSSEEEWLNAVSQATDKRDEAINELRKSYPGLLDDIDNEKIEVEDLVEAYEKLIRLQQERTVSDLVNKRDQVRKEIERLTKTLQSGPVLYGEGGTNAYIIQQAKIKGLQEEEKRLTAEIAARNKELAETIKFEEGWRKQLRDIAPNLYDAQTLKDMSSLAEAIDDLQNKYSKFYEQVKIYNNIPEDSKTPETIENINNAKRNLEQATKALQFFGQALKSAEGGDTSKDPIAERYKIQIDLLKQAQEQYEKYLAILSKNEAEKRVSESPKFASLSIDFQNYSPENTRKYLNQIYDSIKGNSRFKDIQELIESLFTEYDYNDINKSINNLLDNVKNQLEKSKSDYDMVQQLLNMGVDEQTIELLLNVDVKIQNERESLKKAINDLVQGIIDTNGGDIEIETGLSLKDALNNNDIESIIKNIDKIPEEYRNTLSDIYNDMQKFDTEQMLSWAKIVTKYGEFEARKNQITAEGEQERFNINEQYNKLIEKATDENTKKRLELERQSLLNASSQKEKADLAVVEFDALKQTDLWKQAFEDLGRAGDAAIDILIKQIEDFIETSGNDLPIEDFKTLIGLLEDLRNEKIDRNPFEGLVNSLENYRKAKENLGVAEEEYEKAKKERENADKDETLSTDEKAAAADKEAEAYKKLAIAQSDARAAGDDVAKSGEKLLEYASTTTDAILNITDSISGLLDSLGLLSEDGKKAFSELDNIFGGLIGMAGGGLNIAKGFTTDNPLAIIQGMGQAGGSLIQTIASLINLFGKDRKIDKKIKESEKVVKKLEHAYNDLEVAVDKALGEEKYAANAKLISNLQQQMIEVGKQADLERSKKKSDPEKIEELERDYVELGQEINDLLDQIKDDLIGGSVRDVADDLANAFFEAFAAGEDAAKAWGDTVHDIIGNIVKDLLITKFLEQPVADAIDSYYSMVRPVASRVEKLQEELDDYNQQIQKLELSGSSNSRYLEELRKMRDATMGELRALQDKLEKEVPALTEESTNQLEEELDSIYSDFGEIINSLPDGIKKYLLGEGGTGKGLSEGIKGVTEDTASLIASYMNAMRQDVAVEVQHMANINNNVSGIYKSIQTNKPSTNNDFILTASMVKEYLSSVSNTNSYLNDININIVNSRDITAQSLAYLKAIEVNTYNTASAAQQTAEAALTISKNMASMLNNSTIIAGILKDTTLGTKSIRIQ